ncbi:hypothetical protein ACOSQ2_001162 [Xanthoceras sorbifolium]
MSNLPPSLAAILPCRLLDKHRKPKLRFFFMRSNPGQPALPTHRVNSSRPLKRIKFKLENLTVSTGFPSFSVPDLTH